MTRLPTPPREIARAMQLRYVNATQKGYQRVRKGNTFYYLDTEGKIIRNKEHLQRIQDLVLPPAWTDVWICPYPNGHLQATGIDARGRRQYRYHARWSMLRNEHKFDHIYAFGRKLPLLRKQIGKDLRRRTMNREKVIAIALAVMNETYIRAGNTAYEKTNGSYGLTTLKNRHVTINGSQAFFRFKGKKGVMQQIALKNAALTRLLKNVKELPGQELFQYYDEEGELRKLDSGDINSYLREVMSDEFSCKDFRTWAGCTIALQLMAGNQEREDARNLVAIIDGVAARLGNTRAICRKYYIHPQLLQAYEEETLDDLLLQLRKAASNELRNTAAEKALLAFLKRNATKK